MASYTYQDIDFYGNSDSNGSPLEYYNHFAIKNALLTFLLSKRGDFILNPTDGGILDTALFKTLTDTARDKIFFTIKNAINKYFSPKITLVAINVIPNYNGRYWEISITYREAIFNTNEELVVYTKSTNNDVSYVYQEVLFEDDNLMEFAVSKKANMKGKLLLYEPEFVCFVWGQYKLTNLTPSSSNLSEMLAYINLTP